MAGTLYFDSRRKVILEMLYEEGEITRFTVSGINVPFILLKGMRSSSNSRRKSKKGKFLAPLDNMIWDRDMISELFDFNYRWEVYTCRCKKSMVIMFYRSYMGTNLIARFEPEKIASMNL